MIAACAGMTTETPKSIVILKGISLSYTRDTSSHDFNPPWSSIGYHAASFICVLHLLTPPPFWFPSGARVSRPSTISQWHTMMSSRCHPNLLRPSSYKPVAIRSKDWRRKRLVLRRKTLVQDSTGFYKDRDWSAQSTCLFSAFIASPSISPAFLWFSDGNRTVVFGKVRVLAVKMS